jgi:type VI secretion system protein ImpF
MSRPDPNQSLMPSLLDRLIDPESAGTSWRYGYGIEQVMEAVRRDLEDLLNTRQTPVDTIKDFTELRTSVFAYGLPDLTSLNAITPQQRVEIGRLLERIVSTFEPRLTQVKAVLIQTNETLKPSLRFRIDAKLKMEPAPEVAFETTLELTTGRYSIRSAEK